MPSFMFEVAFDHLISLQALIATFLFLLTSDMTEAMVTIGTSVSNICSLWRAYRGKGGKFHTG